MSLDRDPRGVVRGYFSEEPMSFENGLKTGFVVATQEYAYGVVGRGLGYRGRLDLLVPSEMQVIPNRVLLKGVLPLVTERRNSYRWVEEIMVSDSDGRRLTYVGSDLLSFKKVEGGFEIFVMSPYPVAVHRVYDPNQFSSEVLRHRPRR